MNFFAPPYTNPVAGVFTRDHWILLSVTATLVVVALWFFRKMSRRGVYRTICIITAILWVLEIWKIAFNFSIGNTNPNNWVPLYYCSLSLYAGAMSALGRGKIRRVGDVFLATGCVVGGVSFLLLPISSLTIYPALHCIAFHSFALHGMMTYLGILVLMRGYCKPKKSDFWGYFILICIICLLALLVNLACGSNLMFISQNNPGTPIEFLWTHTGVFFTPLLVLGQATVPFWGMYGILYLISKIGTRAR